MVDDAAGDALQHALICTEGTTTSRSDHRPVVVQIGVSSDFWPRWGEDDRRWLNASHDFRSVGALTLAKCPDQEQGERYRHPLPSAASKNGQQLIDDLNATSNTTKAKQAAESFRQAVADLESAIREAGLDGAGPSRRTERCRDLLDRAEAAAMRAVRQNMPTTTKKSRQNAAFNRERARRQMDDVLDPDEHDRAMAQKHGHWENAAEATFVLLEHIRELQRELQCTSNNF